MTKIVIAGTGHRPDKLGGYNQAVWDRTYKLAYDELKRIRPDRVISGMALGWDQCLAQAAVDLKVPYHAYVPFVGQQSKWPRESQLRYGQLMTKAEHIRYVCEGDYAPWKMNVRNQAMVDDCTHVLALWNGSSGGTANCVFYAKKVGRPVHNCWDKFVRGVLQRNLAL